MKANIKFKDGKSYETKDFTLEISGQEISFLRFEDICYDKSDLNIENVKEITIKFD